MKDNASRLRIRLKKVGLSDAAVSAAWPTWWSDAADASPSAQAELRFSIARKLGLDPHSLLEDSDEPRFIWRDEARFKHLSGESQLEQSAITSFGAALGRYLIAATAVSAPGVRFSSLVLRKVILRDQPFIRLVDLLSVCWSIGTPVIHLRIFPLVQKRMSAMTVRVDERNAIMMGKESDYPAHVAFYLAHELAHIALGHLSKETVFVDLESTSLASAENDPEEAAADRFALELLTGQAEPIVLPKLKRYNPNQLADAALRASSEIRIEPGTLVLCFAYSTGDWVTANAAMKRVYPSPKPAWAEINKVALRHLDLDLVPDDAKPYLLAALGDAFSA